MTLPALLAGRKVDPAWLDEVVATVGLADRLGHRPSELSGGQQQRVAVARALVARPEVTFADEPTGNLDSHSGTEILGFLRRAVDTMDQTVVMVTHDPVAAGWADRVLFLADGAVVDEMVEPTADARPRPHEALRRLSRPTPPHTRARSRGDTHAAPLTPHPAGPRPPLHVHHRRRRPGHRLPGRRLDVGGHLPEGLRRHVRHGHGRHRRRRPRPTAASSSASATPPGARSTPAWPTRSSPPPTASPRSRPQRDGTAQIEGSDGEIVGGGGPPQVGSQWITVPELNPWGLTDGRAPEGPEEVVIDAASARQGDLAVGDATRVFTPEAVDVTVVGVATYGTADSAGPLTQALFSEEGAIAHLGGTPGTVDGFLVAADPGVEPGPGHRRPRRGPARRGGGHHRRPAHRGVPADRRGLRRHPAPRPAGLRPHRPHRRGLQHLQHLRHRRGPAHPGRGPAAGDRRLAPPDHRLHAPRGGDRRRRRRRARASCWAWAWPPACRR